MAQKNKNERHTKMDLKDLFQNGKWYHCFRHQGMITNMKTNWLTRNTPVLTYHGHVSGGSFYSLSETALLAMCKAAGFKSANVVSRFDMYNRRHNNTSDHFVVHAFK
jgi:glutamyl/glutaminyl-tRNA synthetase